MKAPQFILPETFDSREFLRTPRLERLQEDAMYFINLVLRKTVRKRVDGRGFVRLKAEHLRRAMSYDAYNLVVNSLLDGGAVVRSGYVVGKKSFGYKLSPRYLADRHVRIAITKERILNAIAAFVAEEQDNQRRRWLPVHHALAEKQRCLRIDMGQAREIIDALPPESNPFDAQGIIARDIHERRFFQKVGQYGRFFNSISNMKREVRPALRVGGQTLASVDLCCAQLAILGKIVRDERATAQREADKDQRPEERQDHRPGRSGAGTKQGQVDGKQGRQATGRDEAGGTNTEWLYDAGFCTPKPSVQNLRDGPPDLLEFELLVSTGRLYDVLQDDLRRGGIELTRSQVKRKVLADVVAKKVANARGAQYPSAVEQAFKRRFPTVHRFITRTNKGGFQHANLIRELQRGEAALVIDTIAADFLLQHP
jgi:hypothetical protein